jgi:hypothetical protein
MVALVTTLLERGERVFAVVGYSHVAMQEAALREALGAPAQAVDARIAPPPVFERLRGEWLGEGTLLGRAARFTMRWQHGDGFAVLTFSNAFVDAAGNATPVLNAAAVYRTDGDKPEAVWLDSRGERIEIRWEATDSALVSHWTAPNERGRTTYSARSADEVEVVDEVLSGETWRTFGTARFTRRDVERAPARGRGGTTR